MALAHPAARGRRSRRRRAPTAPGGKASGSTSTRRSSASAGTRGAIDADASSGKDGARAHRWRASHLLLAAGRRTNVEGLGPRRAPACGRRQGPHRRRRQAAHDQSAHPRRRRRRGRRSSSRTWPSTMPASCCATRSSGLKWTRPSTVIPWARTRIPNSRGWACPRPKRGEKGLAASRLPLPVRRDRPRARRRRDRGLRQDRHRSQGQAARCGHRRAARGRADRRVRARADAGHERRRPSPAPSTPIPTLASISRRVADQRMKEGLTPTAKTWIKRIFGLQGA